MAEAGNIRLSVIVPSLTGEVPQGLSAQVSGRADVELVVVEGVTPVGKARNVGLARAVGDYIAWVDADDEVSSDWLASLLSTLGQSPDVIVIGHKWMMNAEFGFEKTWRGGDLLGDLLDGRLVSGELWNKIIRRDLWASVRFDDTVRIERIWSSVKVSPVGIAVMLSVRIASPCAAGTETSAIMIDAVPPGTRPV